MYKIGWFFNVADVPHIEVIFDHQKAQMSTYFWVRGRLKIFLNDLSFGRCSFSSNDLTLFEQNLFPKFETFLEYLFSVVDSNYDSFGNTQTFVWQQLRVQTVFWCMMQIFTNTQVCFTIWLKLPDAIETYFDKKRHIRFGNFRLHT